MLRMSFASRRGLSATGPLQAGQMGLLALRNHETFREFFRRPGWSPVRWFPPESMLGVWSPLDFEDIQTLDPEARSADCH